jgi:crossover junction endonuclease MUS81
MIEADATNTRDRQQYQVVLLVDHREVANRATANAGRRVSRDALATLIESEHARNGLVVERRELPIGDFIWIARPIPSTSHTTTTTATTSKPISKSKAKAQAAAQLQQQFQQERVLDMVIERKSVADLCASIVDGRYREQRFRLRRSGVQSIAYLIEGNTDAKVFNRATHRSPITHAAFHAALCSIQVDDGFRVLRTQTMAETVNQLGMRLKYENENENENENERH